MVKLDRFFPSIQAWVPDCPSHIIRNAVREAVQITCSESPVWSHKETIGLILPVTRYELDIPDGTEFVEVHSVITSEGRRITDWTSEGHYLNIPARWLGDDVRLTEVIYSLRPAYDNNEIPDSVYSSTSQIIPLGARWQLLDMPGKPWSDPQKAEYYRTRFYQQIGVLRGNLIVASKRNEMIQGAPPLA